MHTNNIILQSNPIISTQYSINITYTVFNYNRATVRINTVETLFKASEGKPAVC